MVVAVVFLAAYSWQVISDRGAGGAQVSETIITATWVMFFVDYLINLLLAEDRWHWFRTHLLDLIIVVLPLLRPLRLLRLVTLLTFLQRTAGFAFRERVVVYVAGASTLLVYVSALSVLDAERFEPGATITTFGDAVWWAFVTITTVGYGDLTPVTPWGRVVAAFLMLGGVALLGVVTATLASWIVERVAKIEEDAQTATRGEVRALSDQLLLLHQKVDAARPASPSASASPSP